MVKVILLPQPVAGVGLESPKRRQKLFPVMTEMPLSDGPSPVTETDRQKLRQNLQSFRQPERRCAFDNAVLQTLRDVSKPSPFFQSVFE